MSEYNDPWPVAYQAPLSNPLEWVTTSHSGGPPDQVMEPVSLVSPAWAAWLFTTRATWEVVRMIGWMRKFKLMILSES